ncbi:MAG: hypothetical protein AMJ90_04490 [candidate division Zixibacteria bacterium SM23_73_2]|nr:MAG: hypothetical protein AMJ90_04490 [candidate division Zixibacteria bacterium SM23_73_2]
MVKKLLFLALLILVSAPAFALVDTAWVRRYDGSGSLNDYGTDVTADDSGFVYVTGGGYETGADFTTIKYYPDGDTVWVRKYDGPGNIGDMAFSIAVDDSGNVCVTGEIRVGGTEGDYATVKYFPNGDTAWVRTYDGPGPGPDRARNIAVDNWGNVLVTGYCGSDAGGTYLDYGTIKYYPDGDTAWIRRYVGPDSVHDEAKAIAVDDSGKVYVTGASGGIGTNYDYATIKYDQNGDTVWVRRYNGSEDQEDGASDIAVDDSGNVYVTGWNFKVSDCDYATIKYFPNGDTAWVRTYDGPANEADSALAIAVDNAGNVYVTGTSYSSTTEFDFATIKYYPNGDTAWVRRYDGPGNDYDQGYAIAVDDNGNVYVTGFSAGDGTAYDYATIKYDPDGNQLWVIRYDGPASGDDYPYSIALDDSGNVYVTGYSWGSGSNYDYATIKYVESCLLPGDVNNDGMVALGDIFILAHYLYSCTPEPACPLSGDVNGNCEVDLADAIWLIYKIFLPYPQFDTLFPYCSYPENFLDPGVRDTLRVDSVEAAPGDDFVIPLSIFNDETIFANMPLMIEDTTKIVIDSIVYQGTRGEGKFFDRLDYVCEGSSGLLIFSPYELESLDSLSPGAGISGYLWGHVKAGAEQGFVKIDTSFLEPNHHLRFFKTQPKLNSLIPEFVYGGVTVLSPHICGDVNDDGIVNLADALCLAQHYFGKPCEIVPWSSDVNCDTLNNLADAMIIAQKYFGAPGVELECCE